MHQGDFLAQLLILPVVHPELIPLKNIEMRTERRDGSFGSSDMQLNTVNSEQSVRISINEIQTSYLHEAIKDLTPTDFEISELNLSVQLPSEPEMSNDILNRFR
ncbi:MAG: hypothetical protein ACK55Z_05495, partial [bacterium]